MKRRALTPEEASFKADFGIKKGTKIHAIIRHVSRSGMQRVIDLYVMKNNEPRWIGRRAADILGWRYTEKYGGGIVVGGCGMDMVFHTVYSLSSCLFPNGIREKTAQYEGESRIVVREWLGKATPAPQEGRSIMGGDYAKRLNELNDSNFSDFRMDDDYNAWGIAFDQDRKEWAQIHLAALYTGSKMQRRSGGYALEYGVL